MVTMFKVLIADDEKFIRKGIISILERNLQEEISYIEARNGVEALEIAERESPDLVISDINMPGCDGLQFIADLKKLNGKTPVIILSGYENFEYAKRAIQLGVKEYVIKPIKKAEFIELIKQYVTNIKSERVRSQEEIVRRVENARIMERLKRDFLLGLLKCPSSEEAHHYLVQLKELGMIFESKLYICAVVQYEVTASNEDYMDFAAKNILDEYLHLESGEELVVNVNYDVGKVVIIFEGNSQEALRDKKKHLIRKAARLVKEYCKVNVFVGVGDVAYDSVHLHTSLRHALLAVDFRLYEGGDIVMFYDDIQKESEAAAPNLVRMLKPVEQINVFEILEGFQKIIRMGQSKAVIMVLRKEYSEVQEYISNQLLRRKNASEVWEGRYKPLSNCWTFTDVKQELKERIELLQGAGGHASAGNAAFMKQILQFVDEHITEELDLNLVAEKFNRTPGYISTMFKKHVEGGFNSYLTNERVEIAKKLLADGSISIQEVSELCGFHNSKYFSVVFKKTTGETPREYREHYSK